MLLPRRGGHPGLGHLDRRNTLASMQLARRESGMCTAASELHPEKARLPIEVTESGMCTAASELQPRKA